MATLSAGGARKRSLKGRRKPSFSHARRQQRSKLRSENLIEIEGLPLTLRARFRQLVEVANDALEGVRTVAKRPPQDRPWSLFKIAVYGHVLRQIKDGRVGQIRSVVLTSPYAPAEIAFEKNPFHWALYALTKSAEFDEYKKLSEEKVSEYGLEMAYAHSHKIPPSLLIGFLYQTQATNSTRRKGIRQNPEIKEPWFDEYLEWMSEK